LSLENSKHENSVQDAFRTEQNKIKTWTVNWKSDGIG